MQRALAQELGRVREVAVAWRNGLAAILAGLVGFGLIKERRDVGQAAPQWAVTAGLLLLAALVAGGLGALSLLCAAHGRPACVRVCSWPRSTVVLKADGRDHRGPGTGRLRHPSPHLPGEGPDSVKRSHTSFGSTWAGFSVKTVFRVIAGRLRSVSGVSSGDLGHEGRPCCG